MLIICFICPDVMCVTTTMHRYHYYHQRRIVIEVVIDLNDVNQPQGNRDNYSEERISKEGSRRIFLV